MKRPLKLKDKKTTLKIWQENPDIYFEECLGVKTLQDYQRQVVLEICKFDKVTIAACHSIGKTWMLARTSLWFLTCFKNSIIITTAPTYNQVENLLWGEIREAYKNSKLPIGGRCLNTKLILSDKWYALGFSPQKSAGVSEEQKGSSFQGFHSDYVMVIFDEATGIPSDIWKMAEGLLTSGKIVKFIAIANPTTRSSEFYKTFTSSRFKKLYLNCFDSPNLKANNFFSKEDLDLEIDRLSLLPEGERLNQIYSYKKPVPHLISAQWVIEFIMEWGFDHPLTVSKVFGEFPQDDQSVLIKMNYVESAIKRNYEISLSDFRYIGVDVARYGNDKTVITEMIGYKVTNVLVLTKRSTTEVTGQVINLIEGEYENFKTTVLVDATGIGSGVIDNLVELQTSQKLSKSINILEVHFGASPANPNEPDKSLVEQDKSRYLNLKAKMFQMLSNDLRDKIDLPENENYLKELPSLKASFDGKGRLKIESKDEYKKRTGRSSPDFSDSLALCNMGRYVNINFGSFKDLQINKTTSIIKRKDGVSSRQSKIKISSY